MNEKSYFWIALFLAVSCQFSWGDIIYVKQGATGTGTSWEPNEALGNLSTALNNAVPNQDQVWVAQGTYSPPAGGSFVIPNNVAVIGGFLGTPGTEGQVGARVSDAMMNNTILTGIGVTPQSRTIVTLLNSDILTEFSSFQITGATESALVATDSQAVIRDVLFLNNNATFGSFDGAAVTISGPLSTLNVQECVFQQNTANDRGGAMHITNNSTPNIESCSFSDNQASSGGAIYINDDSVATVEGCSFESNDAVSGNGGAILQTNLDSSSIFRNCSFELNSSTGTGGAIDNDRSTAMTLIQCDFIQNQSGGDGGAVHFSGFFTGVLDIANGVFRNNTSTSGDGGGVHARKATTVRFDNCLFTRNIAVDGGGLFLESVQDTIIHNATFALNQATNLGGGLRHASSGILLIDIENSILWGNTDSGSSVQDAQLSPLTSAVEVAYSDVDDGDPNPPVIGVAADMNIDEDPLFVDALNDDFRLDVGSPCIDTGDNPLLASDYADLDTDTDFFEKTPLDVRRAERIVDGTATIDELSECDGIVDMGAIEYRFACQACTAIGDLNFDSRVDGLDIAPFVNCLLGGTDCGCACADVRGRNGVGIEDIECFVSLVISGGTEADCVIDECSFVPENCFDPAVAIELIVTGQLEDCNNNLIPDVCEIDENSTAPGGPFYCEANCLPDLNNDGIPDECQADCNGNGIPDDKDISDATATDCNSNGIPDSCSIETDCNNNGVPDDCDIANATSADCDSNGVPDECDQDCDDDGTPDACETMIDCNSNGIFDACEANCDNDFVPDECELSGNDCNENDIPDDCEIAAGLVLGVFDCNDNGVPDACDIADCVSDPACDDCNQNTVPDECDIANQISTDTNQNGIPDECESQQQQSQGGGGSSMMLGGASPMHAASVPTTETWDEFHQWVIEADFSGLTSGEIFSAIVDKQLELGLPPGQMFPE